MQKNRFRIICLCIIFTLCFSLVGCDLASGGILGELLDNLPSDLKDPSGELSSTLDRFTEETEQDPTPETGKPAPETKPGKDTTEPPMTEHPTTDAPVTEPPKTEPPTTEPPTTEAPIDPVTIVFSFDECDMWMNTDTDTTNSSNSVGNFFDPGCAAAWEKIADVDDYNVAYVRVWGWAAFYAKEVGQFGYQIDNNEPVFDDAFAIEAEQAVIDVSLSCGGKSGSRMCIMIPVRDLSGEHTIKALVRDAVGTVELITEFTLIKAVDPYAPIFFVPAADMASSMPGSPDIKDATMSSDGSYITITPGDVGDPYYLLPMINGKGYVAKYVAIKYRTSSLCTYSEMFVGSGTAPCGAGDHIRFDLTCDGRWNLAIVDLSQATAVRDGVINYLRWDCFAGHSDEPIDLAYIAAFDSAEAAQIHFEKSMTVPNLSQTFASNIYANKDEMELDKTDLANYFTINLPLHGSQVTQWEGQKVYTMDLISEMLANMDGAYYLRANVLSSQGNGSFFVRGYQVVNSDTLINSVNTANYNLYLINNYYETDGGSGYGGSGIYATVSDGQLNLIIKCYDPEAISRVGNVTYQIPCQGTEMTMVDDGYTVSIMVDGITYATIELIGAQSYADINQVSPEGQFATRAILKTVDGEETIIENTLVAATANSQIGLVVRGGAIRFTSLEVGRATNIDVPELEIKQPEPIEPIEPIDPNAPIAIAYPDYLADMAQGGNHIHSVEIADGGNYVTITATDYGDPYFYVLPSGGNISGVACIAVKYRVQDPNSTWGQFFVGSGQGPTGGPDELRFDYFPDGEWHVAILDLSVMESVNEQGLVNYLRYDFYSGGEYTSIDLAEIILFGSIEAAHAYYGI